MSKVIGDATTILQRQQRNIRQEFEVCMGIVGDELEFDHVEVTRRWQHRPRFNQTFSIARNFLRVTVQPGGENRKYWVWVDRGTKGPYRIPKIIRPGQPLLRFRTGYSARTQPTAKYNVGTGFRFGRWVTKQQIIHPGIKARRFGKDFAERILPFFKQQVLDAIRRGLSR